MATIQRSASPLAPPNQHLWLRRVLALDAVVTGANGLVYAAASGPVGRRLGVDGDLLLGLGVFLTLYAVAVGCLAGRSRPPAPGVYAVVGANVVWTVLSIVAPLSWFDDLHTAGAVWIPLQAATVGGFALLQIGALRQARA
ncbi:hypothetical protein AQ490_04265 [Wenjunlia vitaminophila]|uniref:Integral membrane protein n=1 Tax=Wenjunlia vitaminophila TaxID=76728 RepID=A0A0T6LQZ2_WENVI|nr:hypothetical protein [Wenjunlia vitaminophila]KRV48470.1 hypothetical protein AQ490_04265 [Wenjunlia vitaminophila]